MEIVKALSRDLITFGTWYETTKFFSSLVVGGKTNTHVSDADAIGYWTKILAWRSSVCICPPK